jgi:hypothetical protein
VGAQPAVLSAVAACRDSSHVDCLAGGQLEGRAVLLLGLLDGLLVLLLLLHVSLVG